MSKQVFFLFLFVLLGNIRLSYAEYFNHIGLSEGLSSPSVMAIYQDCLGRMWFGTKEGLNVYDGNRITVYQGWLQTAQDTVPSIWLGNDVAAIISNKQDDIYMLIDDRIIKYDIRHGTFNYIPEGKQVSALTSFEGDIWYARQDSLFCLKNGTEKTAYVCKLQQKSVVNHLNIQKDYAYVSTKNGVFVINRQTYQQQHLLEGTDVYSVFVSSRNEIWIGTRMNGLYKKKPNGSIYTVPYRPQSTEGISSKQIREFVEDNEGNIWFGTFDGLHKYTSSTGKYQLIQIPKYMGGITHPSIFSLYKDIQGTIWIGSYFGGVNYFSPQQTDFTHYNYQENALTDLSYSYIGDLITDRNHHLWFGTDGGGICCIDKDWNIVKQFTAGKGNALPHNNIKSICYDEKRNCLYIGTYLGGLSQYNLNTGRFHNYPQSSSSSELPSSVIYHVKMYGNQLYLTARNGVFRLDIQTQKIYKLPIRNAYYEHFDIDNEGNMYLLAWDMLVLSHVARPDSVNHIPLTVKGHQTTANKVLATPQGAYITTLGSGLLFYDKQKQSVTRYTVRNSQLPNDFCYSLSYTPSGKILITHPKGVSCFNTDNQSFTTLDIMNQFPSAHIINGCGIHVSATGEIYVGDTEGVTSFHENEFLQSPKDTLYTHFYFSELWINNRLVSPNDESHVLTEVLPYTQKLHLNHHQNNFTIRFTFSDYKEQVSEKWFMYKLEGFDKQWIQGKQTELNYTNLNPGKYTLRIVAINKYNGQRISDELQMAILISTPWYSTWWAWLSYILCFAGCVSYFISNRIRQRTLALSLEKERFEKQQAEQLGKEKMEFFTNVSHEFRTPLTLIISHIDMLLRNSLSPTLYNSILKIRKNAQYMNNLVSELLEFRKLEQNRETICLKHQDIRSFLKEIYLSFADYAKQREIIYQFRLPDTPIPCWFDPRLMEKVFFNLLSNAFKYTADKGEITLSGDITDNEIYIQISDTGIGISEQETGLIFNRFYQGGNPKDKKDVFKGTGIGLTLTKNIIEKHHGNITVESTLGKGSTFTVKLPLQESVFQQDTNVQFVSESEEPTIISDSIPSSKDEEKLSEIAPRNNDNSPYNLLLVEDNEELLQVLKKLFSPFYNVICARNGKEGLNLVHEQKPDLVISDIMMPEMTGTEMCLQIKNNIDLCHIPIILLTALNSPEHNLEGLNRGADDYIAKPFHAQLLLARANNLIRNRLLVQHQFNKKPISEIDLSSINPLDQDLLKRTTQIIEKHIDDVDFDIPALCKEVGVGRSLLYAKFKALTGMTPNNFILNYRLQHAAMLLQKYPDLPISEISDRCGFSTSVYFSRCFKNQYECTPREYQKKKQ